MKTKATMALLACTLLLATAAAAPADPLALLHFALRSSQPAADSSVTPPEEIVLTFTEPPQENSVGVRLIDPAGEAVELGDPTPDDENPSVIRVEVGAVLVASEYTVAWRGMGDDGHVVRGDFVFSVTAPQ